jgi:tetratricopeptide (TPR) repeat protein
MPRRTALAAGVLCLAAGAAVAQSPEELFRRGNQAYEQGEYEAAAEAYRSVLQYDIRDPIVEYNLGNAEFRRGNLGRAILHYERARRLDPIDSDIAANLEFARSLCFDRVEPPQQAAVVRWVHAAQDRIGPGRQAWGLVALVWIVCGAATRGFARPGGWNARLGWLLTVASVALLVVFLSWYSTLERLEGGRPAVVLDDVAEVLAGPGWKNPALFTVHEGLTVQIRGERDEWLQVSLPNGLHGWIARASVEEV